MNYKTENTVVYACRYHVVWCTKFRRRVLVDEIAAQLKEMILNWAPTIKCEVISMDIQPDHVHLLLDVPPEPGLRKAVCSLKNHTASKLRTEFTGLKTRLPAMWTTSYFATTDLIGFEEAVQQYIEQQNTSSRKTEKAAKITLPDNEKEN